MLEPFSSGYYLGRLYVEPASGESAVLNDDLLQTANRELLAASDGIDHLDAPLVMKLQTRHFPVHAAEGVPEGTLGVPYSLLESTHIDNPPTLTEVLVAKPEIAQRLVAFGAV